MKLAFCLFNYFPFGGLQRDFLRIAKECVHRGHSVHVYTMRWEGEKDPDLTLSILSTKGWQNHTRISNFVSQVQKKLAKEKYDLIVGFNKMPGLDVYYAADTCYQANVQKKHGFLYKLTPRYQRLIAYEKAVFSADRKTEILLISPLQQSEFIHFYKTETKRFHLLPPGIARDRIAPSHAETIRRETREEFKIPPTDLLLLFVGSGFKTKGLDRVLQGLYALPDDLKRQSHLFIIGKDNATLFQKQAEKLLLSDSIHFLGGREDVSRFLLAADLLVHPAYNENTGTVLLEAVVSGLPVLTTDVCGYAHYILEANAGIVLSSPFQQKKFDHALEKMLLSKERSSWHDNGLEFAKQADIYSMPLRAVDILDELYAKKTKVSP